MSPSSFRDALQLWRVLNPSRLRNALAVWSSFYLSRWTKRPVQWGLPFSIAIEPTTSCNLRCPECPSGLRSFSRPTGMLDADFFRQVVDEVAPQVFYLTFYFQGEPYLHPRFTEMVQYAVSKKIYTATSTNAHYLTDEMAKRTVESGLHRLIISLDGTTQDVYEQYRIGGRLEKVLEGARQIVKWKQRLRSVTPYVFFQFLVVKPNEHQIEDVKRLANEFGIDVHFKTAQVYDYANGHPLIPEQEKYARYKRMPDGQYKVKSSLENSCWKLWHSCVLTWDGQVVPCCFDKDATHRMGDMKLEGLKDIWRGAAYRQFRQRLHQGRREIDICANCSEGTRVWEG